MNNFERERLLKKIAFDRKKISEFIFSFDEFSKNISSGTTIFSTIDEYEIVFYSETQNWNLYLRGRHEKIEFSAIEILNFLADRPFNLVKEEVINLLSLTFSQTNLLSPIKFKLKEIYRDSWFDFAQSYPDYFGALANKQLIYLIFRRDIYFKFYRFSVDDLFKQLENDDFEDIKTLPEKCLLNEQRVKISSGFR